MNTISNTLGHRLHPYVGKDINWLVDAQAEMRGDKTLLIWEPFEDDPRSYSYADFRRESIRFAAGLRSRGLQRGDYLLIHMQNCPEFLITWFACARLGVIAVTTNTRYSCEELAFAISHSGAKVVVTQADLWEQPHNQKVEAPEILIITSTDQNASSVGENWEDVPQEDSELLEDIPRDPMHPLCIMYTSGTTSRPKGVVWTHANGLWCGHTTSQHLLLTESDVAMTVFPLFHTNAMGYSVLGTLWSGGTIVLQPKFSASRYWDVVTRNQCTWSSANGFLVGALQDKPVPSHSLRIWPVGVSDFSPLEDHFNIKLVGMWGMTETAGQGIVSFPQLRGRDMSMGMVATEYEVAVRGADGLDVVPTEDGAIGELLVRGVPGISLFKEYFRDEEATRASFDEDGWFFTGDIVTVFSDGSLVFSDRDKDMLRVGSENVAASEIERVIMAVPGVVEAAVVARPDKMLEQVPVAFVIVRGDRGEVKRAILDTCDQSLADFKQPREVRFVDEFPRATLDKVSKKALRGMLKETDS